MYPMTYASFEKEEHGLSVVWADSSGRILSIMGEGDRGFMQWVGTNYTIAINRLLSAGWKEVNRGKVEK